MSESSRTAPVPATTFSPNSWPYGGLPGSEHGPLTEEQSAATKRLLAAFGSDGDAAEQSEAVERVLAAFNQKSAA